MLWDDGSLSNSPTSVKTPDGELFEVEMLDSESMRNFYHQTGVNMSTQVSHNAIPAVDNGMFLTPQGSISDHGMSVVVHASFSLTCPAIEAALHDTMLSHGQQYQQHYSAPFPQGHNMPTTHAQSHAFTPNYTTQPSQHDPWNGQGPSRSSMTPRSGNVIFDAITDPVNYGDYLNDWRINFTDPDYLISPSEHMAPPQENFFPPIAAQNLVYRPQINNSLTHVHHPISPVGMQIIQPSPPPDQQNFVNYNASSRLFTESYIVENRHPPSSPGNSSTGQYARSPYQPPISPSAGSPGSSNGTFSYQHSDSGMFLDFFPRPQYDRMMPAQNTPMQINHTQAQNMPEVTLEAAPEQESAAAVAARNLVKNGGRALGTHLEPEVAKAAHDMRKIAACWHCVLQRDRCGPGDICERCLKRSQRPNADCGLGCIRIKLVELAHYFLPGLVTQMHEDSHLKHFVSQHIHQWGSQEFTVYMTCGRRNMPRIPVKVYEFMPRGNELLVQIQYVTDPITNERKAVKKQSPALGMVHINHNEEKMYDKYISDIVDNHLDAFGELCWLEDDNDFQQKLFRLMTRVKPKNDDEVRSFTSGMHSMLTHHRPNSSAKSSASSS